MKKFLSLILSIIMMFAVMPTSAFAASNVPVVTLSNVASTGKIKVSWTKVSGAEGYSVWRSTSKNGNYDYMIYKTSTSYINTSTVAGKTYYYMVQAHMKNGDLRTSAVIYRTCDLAKPEAMSSLNSDGYPKLIWKNVKNATSYDVYRATSKNGTYKLMKNTTSTSYVNTSATNGKTYYYKVKAKCGNSAADSVFSKVVPITCLRGMYVKSVTCKNGDVYTFAFENKVPFKIGNVTINSIKVRSNYLDGYIDYLDGYGDKVYYPSIVFEGKIKDEYADNFMFTLYDSEGVRERSSSPYNGEGLQFFEEERYNQAKTGNVTGTVYFDFDYQFGYLSPGLHIFTIEKSDYNNW